MQAFLELNSEECAQTMVSYYSSVTPVIRNHPIYMQYSTHKELKTDNSPNQVVNSHKHLVFMPSYHYTCTISSNSCLHWHQNVPLFVLVSP